MTPASLSVERAERQTRLRLGLMLGFALGLTYGALSSSINVLLLWGVPLRTTFVGILASTLFNAIGLAAVGCITAWSESSLKGIGAGALFLAAYGVLRAYQSQTGGAVDFFDATILLLTTFLPSAALSLIISLPLRLVINWHEEGLHHSGRPRLYRLGRVWAALIALGVFAGSTAQWPAEAREAVRAVNDMIRTTLETGNVPPALELVPDFWARASARYTLDQHGALDQDASIAGALIGVQTTIVDVQFDTGLHLQCAVNKNVAWPLCSEVRE